MTDPERLARANYDARDAAHATAYAAALATYKDALAAADAEYAAAAAAKETHITSDFAEVHRPTQAQFEASSGRGDNFMPQHTSDSLPDLVYMNPWLDGFARPWPRNTEMHETDEDDACVPYVRLDAVEAAVRRSVASPMTTAAVGDGIIAAVRAELRKDQAAAEGATT